MNEWIAEIKAKNEKDLAKLEQGFRDQEARDGHAIDSAIKQKIRFEGMSSNWKDLEWVAIPCAFNAATLLQLIENPGTTNLDVLPMSRLLPGVGACAPRSYAERMFGKNNQPQNDDYFVFHPDLHRPAITHEAIVQDPIHPERTPDINPDRLRLLLFPRA